MIRNKYTKKSLRAYRSIISAIMIMCMASAVILSAFAWDSGAYAANKKQETISEAEMLAAEVPLRETHQVKVGTKKYCFFVTKNVILTPDEIAKVESDIELTNLILKRAGLYIRESSCRKEKHAPMSVDDWIKSKKSFLLSDDDIRNIRNAEPAAGSPVRLLMDIGLSAKPAAKPAVPAASEPATDDSGDTTDPVIADNTPGLLVDGEFVELTDGMEIEVKPETSIELVYYTGGEYKSPDDVAFESSTGTKKITQNPISGKELLVIMDEKVHVSGTYETTTQIAADIVVTEAKEEEEDPPVTVIEYSTYRKLEIPLLYVVIATPEDAKAGAVICPYPEDKPDDIPDVPDGIDDAETEPEEILPEYRTIEMVDRSGAPLEPALLDGRAKTLKWIEPSDKKNEEEGQSSFIDKIPGGWYSIAGLLALLIALILLLIKRNKEEKEVEF